MFRSNFVCIAVITVTLSQVLTYCHATEETDIDPHSSAPDESPETTSTPVQHLNEITGVKSCGRVGPRFTGRRIVGGRSAALDEFPYQIALEGKSFDGKYRQFCGGTVISDRWVLTAAHCVRGTNARNLRVVAGTNNLTDVNDKTVLVSKLIPHERYNTRTIQNDIALVKLASHLSHKINGFISPICLPSRSSTMPVGTSAIISGYGTLRENGSSSKKLLATNIPIQPDSQCFRVYSSQYKPPMMMCAGDLRGGKDTCQGDSGGPLAIRNNDGTYVLLGVTSFGQGCARAYTPGVYTRVSNYLDWIDDKIKSNQ